MESMGFRHRSFRHRVKESDGKGPSGTRREYLPVGSSKTSLFLKVPEGPFPPDSCQPWGGLRLTFSPGIPQGHRAVKHQPPGLRGFLIEEKVPFPLKLIGQITPGLAKTLFGPDLFHTHEGLRVDKVNK